MAGAICHTDFEDYNKRQQETKKEPTDLHESFHCPFLIRSTSISVKSLEDALLLAKGRDVYISGGYGLFKEALQIVDKMYITEVDLNIEDGDTFFPEFDINDFEVLIGETLGEEVKYTRTFYVRKNELSRFWI